MSFVSQDSSLPDRSSASFISVARRSVSLLQRLLLHWCTAFTSQKPVTKALLLFFVLMVLGSSVSFAFTRSQHNKDTVSALYESANLLPAETVLLTTLTLRLTQEQQAHIHKISTAFTDQPGFSSAQAYISSQLHLDVSHLERQKLSTIADSVTLALLNAPDSSFIGATGQEFISRSLVMILAHPPALPVSNIACTGALGTAVYDSTYAGTRLYALHPGCGATSVVMQYVAVASSVLILGITKDTVHRVLDVSRNVHSKLSASFCYTQLRASLPRAALFLSYTHMPSTLTQRTSNCSSQQSSARMLLVQVQSASLDFQTAGFLSLLPPNKQRSEGSLSTARITTPLLKAAAEQNSLIKGWLAGSTSTDFLSALIANRQKAAYTKVTADGTTYLDVSALRVRLEKLYLPVLSPTAQAAYKKIRPLLVPFCGVTTKRFLSGSPSLVHDELHIAFC